MSEWFLSKQAQRIGLAVTIACSAMCVPDMAAAFAPRCSVWARMVVVPRIIGTYRPVTSCAGVSK